MDDHVEGALLIQASRLLGEGEFELRHVGGDGVLALLHEVRRLCDESERNDDAETAATIAILRSTAAAYALRHCVYEKVNCDFDDEDGTLLNGVDEHDAQGVSRPLVEEAVRAARAALDANPDDALVPLHLGHALTWSGDPDGAVQAYEEALRRDPWESCARSALEYLGAPPADQPPNEMSWDEANSWDREPELSPMSRGRHGFALLRSFFWVNNNDSDHRFLLFGSVADACAYAEETLGFDAAKEDFEGDDDGYDEDDGIVLHVHRPGRAIVEYELKGPGQVAWSEPLESPLPPGRPLRINTRTCF
ncbi:hypothetical protein ACQP1W_29475 [Spirillospora sp. CA-255316]